MGRGIIFKTTIRAFIAVEIDEPNKQKILNLISQLNKSDAAIKWATEHQMHLTLKFLGNINDSDIQKISASLKSIAGDSNAFSIKFPRIGAFPNMNRPRVIWLGIDKGAEDLTLLNSKIENELEKLGFVKEKREYSAHLTLGRVKSLKNIQNLTKLINEIELNLQDEIKINKIILFQSTLTPKGAVYTTLKQYNLPSTNVGEV